MPQAKAPNRVRLEIGDLKKLIVQARNTLIAAKGDRDEANADIALALETCANAGIGKKAFRMALQYAEMNDDDKAGFDVAYAICREAFGHPMEDQLFDTHGKPNVHFPEAKEPAKRGRPPKQKEDENKEQTKPLPLGPGGATVQ